MATGKQARATGGSRRGAAPPLAVPLLRTLEAELGGDSRALGLCAAFLGATGYSARLAAKLLKVAAGGQGDRWEVRRLAALMLQQQMLRLPAGDLPELDRLLARLGLKKPGVGSPLRESVLAEGYTRRDLPGFARELRRRLARARRVLDGVRGPRTSPAALRSFLAFARRECKLALARYLFTPEEVVERILAQVGVSRGILDPFPADRPHIDDEARLRLALLPSYEAAILDLLIGWSSTIYWVKKDTGRALNSLVEYPLGTVVLVVKPPGSELEIEIKRTGRRDGPPLSAVFVRDGREVPSWHRLDGGSIVTALHADAHAGSLLAAAFRQVHGGEPPLACTLAVASVYGVPVDGREVPILDYFTQPPDFGPGFAAMRRAMAAAVEAFERERGACLPELPGDLSLTSRFINRLPPGQAILAGTSAFRLDRLALYLSELGPAAYFTPELGVEPSVELLRQLADDLLEEVLGRHALPAGEWPGYPQYLAAAFALPANRARADRIYRRLMRAAGALWGTLCALRGCSWGESFVDRNVGLKSRWEGGRWRVGIVFMDHDGLRLGDVESIWPRKMVQGMRFDQLYLLGRQRKDDDDTGSAGLLQQIYRTGEETERRGREELLRATFSAYRKTLRALRVDPRLRRLLPESFLGELGDWDAVLRQYFRRDPAADGAWKARVERSLVRRGYREPRIRDYFQALAEEDELLELLAPLYRPRASRRAAARP